MNKSKKNNHTKKRNQKRNQKRNKTKKRMKTKRGGKKTIYSIAYPSISQPERIVTKTTVIDDFDAHGDLFQNFAKYATDSVRDVDENLLFMKKPKEFEERVKNNQIYIHKTELEYPPKKTNNP